MMRSVLSVCVMFTLLLQGLNAQLQVRLVNGTAPWNGVLEVLFERTWRTVCRKKFRKQDAQVVCRMLGFNTSQVYTASLYRYSMNFNRIRFDNLGCTGNETSLDKCSHRVHTCRYFWASGSTVIGITCNSRNIQVRLRTMQPNRRHVHIDIGVGRWGPVCVSSNNTARVVCRQLGLPWLGARTFLDKYFTVPGDLSSCLGNETSIAECQHEVSIDGDCPDYNITCTDSLVNINTNSSRYPLMEEKNATLKCESNSASD
ncbi:deleted in malignant brain tumors 1 protein-like [Pomacea canaliculata]|uniref:deleted in malignant brain tumors 1 protein-like n=1 Tax=Pomacea canaliculata TaxID=400727 RepID=UPI000D729961|nr:deleted in malignant brain tumors 1 protein-like [Pomacea canaliculata]